MNVSADTPAGRLLIAGIASFQKYAPGMVPSDESALDEAVEQISAADLEAANMIRLALSQNTAETFLRALAES